MGKWRAVRYGEVDHQPSDHYGLVEQTLSPYSLGLEAHSGRHLRGSWSYWTPSGSVSGRSSAVNDPHVLVV